MMDLQIFTDKIAESGRRLIRKSYDEAISRHHNQMTAEHVLLSFARTEPAFFDAVLQSLSLAPQVVLEALEKQLSRYEGNSRIMKMSESFRMLLSNAHKQARENNRRDIESTDLFAAIFTNREDFCSKLFWQFGAVPEVVIQTIQKQIRSNKPVDPQPPSNQRGH
jgi:ATP-dependent Clp protease ATP-binding subunit ClpA